MRPKPNFHFPLHNHLIQQPISKNLSHRITTKNKPWLASAYNGALFRHKWERSTNTCHDVDKRCKHDTVKAAGHKGPQIAGVPSYEIPRTGKSVKTQSRLVGPRRGMRRRLERYGERDASLRGPGSLWSR